MRALITTAVLAAALPVVAVAAPESYTIDSFHSYPNFTVEHLGLMNMYGRFDRMTGKFTMDRVAKTGSVELTIDVASVSTGDNVRGTRARTRDEHLRQADFFNVAEFPNITFKSSAVRFGPTFPSAIEGTMTMLGVSKPVTLTVERFNCIQHPVNKRDMCGGNAVGKIKRSDFGMNRSIPAIGDEITLMVAFEAFKD